ncbi:MAG: DUF5028 domain-containing protein [Lachnospiraceae bacterium]|nr:DUF5028 domain-containing protein [Lachnospiraceae bacterium]
MKNKKTLVLIVLLCITAGTWFSFYRQTNENISMPSVKEYSLGEWVPMEDDFYSDGENMNGYEVKVVKAELLPLEEYLKNNAILLSTEEKKEFDAPEKVYDLTLRVKNTNKTQEEEVGMNFWPLSLQGKELYLDTNDILYEKVNPKAKGEMQFALRPQTEMEFHLPFNVRKDWFSQKCWNNIEKYKWNFVLTTYPEKKVVRIQP